MAKSKYETHVLPYLEKITGWAKEGATAKAIAEKLKVAYSTFRNYLDLGEQGDERYMALSAAFAQACVEPDDNVETALYQRACGITYEEVKVEEVVNRKTGARETLTTRTTKFIPPDPTSAMFWLTNRRPARWSYKPEGRGDDDGDGSGIIFLAQVDEGLQGGGGDG